MLSKLDTIIALLIFICLASVGTFGVALFALFKYLFNA